MKQVDGTTTRDVRLDRLIQFDSQSRSYPIRTLVPKTPRSYTWSCKAWLDQGREGACVGFAWSHELIARPALVQAITDHTALALYKAAQGLDEWEGEDYSGTSIIAGAKAVQALGFMPEYRWSFSIEELILGVGYSGPAVLGLNWYQGMFRPNDKGYITPSGQLSGGHAILCNGVDLKRERLRLHNSWGADWGERGECWISFSDMDRLLKERGEACFPVKRRK